VISQPIDLESKQGWEPEILAEVSYHRHFLAIRGLSSILLDRPIVQSSNISLSDRWMGLLCGI
jgi:hypothetical protein